MNPDLTKLVLHTNYPAFKNNTDYQGFFSITGVTAGGLNQVSAQVALETAPDLSDVIFNGPTDTVFASDPRPSAGWFKQGFVWVRGDNAPAGYTNYPTPWFITQQISGTTMTITASYVQQFTAALTLTSTACSYKIIDYSVF